MCSVLNYHALEPIIVINDDDHAGDEHDGEGHDEGDGAPPPEHEIGAGLGPVGGIPGPGWMWAEGAEEGGEDVPAANEMALVQRTTIDMSSEFVVLEKMVRHREAEVTRIMLFDRYFRDLIPFNPFYLACDFYYS